MALPRAAARRQGATLQGATTPAASSGTDNPKLSVGDCALIPHSPQQEWVLASPSDGQKAQRAAALCRLTTN